MLHRWPIIYFFSFSCLPSFIAILSVNNYYGVNKTSKSVIRMSKKFGNDTYSIRDLSTHRLTPERFVLYPLFNDPLYFFSTWELISYRKPIFHCDAKYLALGVGVGQCPRLQNFVLEIPTCWYLLHWVTQFFCVLADAKPESWVLADAKPNASQWNIGCVGSQRKILALVMYISFFWC